MGMAERVRSLFAGDEYEFGRPCSEAGLRRAEAAPGGPLQPMLRELYGAFDGFTGCTGAAFLWPLFGDVSLVEANRLYRGDDVFPRTVTNACLFFGDNGCRLLWGLRRDVPGGVVRWNLTWPGAGVAPDGSLLPGPAI